jgi:hypothetical protein
VKITIEADDITDLAQRYQSAARNVPRSTRAGLEWMGQEFVKVMRGVLDEERWRQQLLFSVAIKEIDDTHVVIGPTADHALPVLTGTGAHWAPLDAITEWTMSKLGGDEVDARAIWYTIAQEGTSSWYERKYGTRGFQYPRISLESEEGQATLRTGAKLIGEKIVAEISDV